MPGGQLFKLLILLKLISSRKSCFLTSNPLTKMLMLHLKDSCYWRKDVFIVPRMTENLRRLLITQYSLDISYFLSSYTFSICLIVFNAYVLAVATVP